MTRDEFLDVVYDELYSDGDNNRANRIIDAADSYAEPKTGKWKNIVDGIEYSWGTCDMCGARIPMAYKYYEYCPHCGSRNEVTE